VNHRGPPDLSQKWINTLIRIERERVGVPVIESGGLPILPADGTARAPYRSTLPSGACSNARDPLRHAPLGAVTVLGIYRHQADGCVPTVLLSGSFVKTTVCQDIYTTIP
jgi:hypothetical protein